MRLALCVALGIALAPGIGLANGFFSPAFSSPPFSPVLPTQIGDEDEPEAPSATSEEPVRSVPSATSEEPVRSAPSATSEDPVRSVPSATREEPVRSAPSVTSEEPVRSAPSVTREEPVRSVPSATREEPVRSVPSVTSEEPVRSVPSVTREEPSAPRAIDDGAMRNANAPLRESICPENRCPTIILADGCTACHGAESGPLASLAGKPADQLKTALAEFKAGSRRATVMDRIARGYSQPQIDSIAAYWSAQMPQGGVQ